jgi:hypothetical protein
MARLFDGFSAFVAFGLALDAAIADGRPTLSHDAAQQQARRCSTWRADADAAGTPAPQVESAAFAMVAWIDEILARHPRGRRRTAAAGAALQLEQRAQRVLPSPVGTDRAGRRGARGLLARAGARLQGPVLLRGRRPGRARQAERPARPPAANCRPCPPAAWRRTASRRNPTACPTRAARHDTRRRDRALLRAGASLALLLPLLYLLWLVDDRAARTRHGAWRQRIEQHLQSFACADLTASLDKDGRTRVSGFVSLPGDLPRVEREVAPCPASAPRFDIGLRVWPHCEVFAILKPYQARNVEKAYGLDVSAPSAHDGKLREGDSVRVQVVAPRHDSYIWVDYYTADGSVMHLNTGQVPTRLHASETLELGRDIPSSWLVSPPFGNVLITVLSAPMPFGETADRPPYELASAYLLRLREALAASKNSERLIADFVFLETISR